MKKENDVRITVRIPEDIKKWLVEYADSRDLTLSYLVRRALEEYIDKRGE